MLTALLLLLTLADTPFGSSVDRALNSAQNRDWKDAMAALDSAWTDDPAAFEANNLYYLRGRVAEEQQDWARALEDFTQDRSQEPSSSAGGLARRQRRDEAWHRTWWPNSSSMNSRPTSPPTFGSGSSATPLPSLR